MVGRPHTTLSKRRPMMGLIAIVAVSLSLSLFFFWVWYERYLRWDFNEKGRYYDAEQQVVYTDAGFVWVIPACGFLLIGMAAFMFRAWRGARKRNG